MIWNSRLLVGDPRPLPRASPRITILLVAALCALPLHAKDKDDRARLETVLKRVLVGQSAQTQIILGQPVSYFESVVNDQVTRMVCTDFEANGSISYVMPWNVIPVLPKKVVTQQELSAYAAAGSQMQVQQVFIVRDRFVLDLVEKRTGRKSQLRLWYSKGFAGHTDPLAIVDRLTRLLKFEGPLAKLSKGSEGALSSAARAYEAPGLANSQRLDRAAAYLELVQTELERRRAWTQLSGQPATVSDLEATQTSLQQTIASLAQQIHGPRLEELRTEMTRVAGQIDDLRQSIATQGNTEDDLDAWESLTDEWRGLLAEYEALSGPGARDHRVVLTNQVAELSQARRKSVLAQEEWLAVDTRAARDAIGETAADSAARIQEQEEWLKNHTELIEERQILLSQLKEPAPAEVTARLEADESWSAERHALMESARDQLRPELLDAEYQSLQNKRLRLYDKYTLAFGGPGHRQAGIALMEHLDLMIENRREAVRLGKTAAGSQLSELQRTRQQISSQTP